MMKKNPFMSMWLSAANRMAGSMRGHVTGQVKRQASAAMTEAIRENLKVWTSAGKPTRTKPRK